MGLIVVGAIGISVGIAGTIGAVGAFCVDASVVDNGSKGIGATVVVVLAGFGEPVVINWIEGLLTVGDVWIVSVDKLGAVAVTVVVEGPFFEALSFSFFIIGKYLHKYGSAEWSKGWLSKQIINLFNL